MGYSYSRTLEKLDVLVTSMDCILDVRPYFLDVTYARMPCTVVKILKYANKLTSNLSNRQCKQQQAHNA